MLLQSEKYTYSFISDPLCLGFIKKPILKYLPMFSYNHDHLTPWICSLNRKLPFKEGHRGYKNLR